MTRRKGSTRRYPKAQKVAILKRVQAGETQVAVAAATGVPLATVGYWTRKAKGSSPAANGTTRTARKRGRPAGSRKRAVTGATKAGGIAWALEAGTLVIRIPLRVFARQIAEEALRKI